jgi:hypothetical protein
MMEKRKNHLKSCEGRKETHSQEEEEKINDNKLNGKIKI